MNQGNIPSGQVVRKVRKSGRVSFAIRFRAYGRRHLVTLGYADQGWDAKRAQQELENVLADVRRGIWQPPQSAPAPEPQQDPTFHQFASDWFRANEGRWRPKTRVDYLWQLSSHLLPFFAEHTLRQITVAEVDRYRNHKVSEGVLSAASINKTLTRLGQVLDVADEYSLIERNPLRVNPRNRKLKAPKPTAVWLDRADQIESLLEAAAQLDRDARADGRHIPRHAMLATLVFGGLRLGELLHLHWRDVDLAGGRLRVAESKTDAGVRHVEMLPALRDALAVHRAAHRDAPASALVFCTREGTAFLPENYRDRTFAPAVALANQRRAEAGLSALPQGLSPHKLRHTCCSLLFASGWELPRVMRNMGHSDSATTLRVYSHVMQASDHEREQLRRLIAGEMLDTRPPGWERFVWMPGDLRKVDPSEVHLPEAPPRRRARVSPCR